MRSVQKISLLVLVASLGAAPAVAQPTPQAATGAAAVDDVRKADELFHEANRLVKAKQWAEAEVKFQAAWALNPTYDVALNLGQTQYRLGKSRDAAEHLAFAVRNWPLVGKREPREVAEQRVNELRQVLTALTIRVNEPGATILVDGRMVGRAPLDFEVFVDPGSRTIEAQLAGHEHAMQTVVASKGAAQTVMLTLTVPGAVASTAPTASASAGPPPFASSTAPKPLPGSPGPSTALIIASGMLAAGGLAAGIGFTVAANGKSSEAAGLREKLPGRSGCPGTPNATFAADCSTLKSTLAEQSTMRNAALISFAAGGAFALVAAGLGVWKLKSPTTTTGRVHVAPVLGAREGGILIGGAW